MDATSISTDVALSNLSSLIDGQTQQLSVRAVNSEGPATGTLQSVTVTSHPSTSVYRAYIQKNKQQQKRMIAGF